jgi:hypothetical protein
MGTNALWQAIGNASVKAAIFAFNKIQKPSHHLF